MSNIAKTLASMTDGAAPKRAALEALRHAIRAAQAAYEAQDALMEAMRDFDDPDGDPDAEISEGKLTLVADWIHSDLMEYNPAHFTDDTMELLLAEWREVGAHDGVIARLNPSMTSD